MRNFLLAFLVFLVWSFFGLWLYSWLDPIENNTQTATTKKVVNENLLKTDEPIKIDEAFEEFNTENDTVILTENEDEFSNEAEIPKGLKAETLQGDLLFAYNEGISFKKNSSEVFISEKIKDFIYKLNSYSIQHPNEELHIAAIYSASENIETPNLGIQRGEKIAELLEKIGVSKEKVVVKSVIRDVKFDKNNESTHGISFSFQPLDTERVASIKLELPKTKTIYPKLVNNDIFVTEALQDLLTEVKNVTTENPNINVIVIGHTDNVGNANDNYHLGLKYSRQVRWYLVTKGAIDRKRIIAISEGESKSIASNKTERGRFLNRRIEVRYKEK